MERRTLQTLLSAVWVLLGAVQAALALGDAPMLAALWGVYALLGAVYYWSEVYRTGDE